MRCRPLLLPLLIVAAVALGSPARAEKNPAAIGAALKSARAQGHREELFRLLMNGQTPSWLQGKPAAEVARRTAAIKQSVLTQGRKVVRAIVATPDGAPSRAEQLVLGLLSPAQRAQLLKEEASFKVEAVQLKVNGQPTEKLKITLKRYPGPTPRYSYGEPPVTPEFTKQMNIYNRVMGPNLYTYAPAGGHSKYVSRGEVFDIWGNNDSTRGPLRAMEFPLFPTWLSDAEAARMKTVIEVGRGSWYSSLGSKLSHGRPAMWPPAKGKSAAKTGNSCTTTFIRAPIGERDAGFAWIDALQGTITAAAKAGRLQVPGVDLSSRTLLEAVTGQTKVAYSPIFAEVARQLPAEAAKLEQLRGEVDHFYGALARASYWAPPGVSTGNEACTFPLELMHRAPLATLANIQGDPVGPKGATQKFKAADPTRIGVLAVFEKVPKPK